MRKKATEQLFYFITTGEFLTNIYLVFSDGSFTEIKQVNLRYDDTLENPLRIEINSQENSIIINEQYGFLFVDRFYLDAFLDELFFILEEYLEVDLKDRSTSPEKEIVLENIILGEKNEKLDDSKAVEEQSD